LDHEGRISGWIYKIRKHGKIVFIDLRNLKGITQCVGRKEELNESDWSTLYDLTQESYISLEGRFKEEKRAPGGLEFQIKKVLSYRKAQSPYPLGKKSHPPDVLMKYRHLTVRSPFYQAIFKIRSNVMKFARDWFSENGWYEVSPPIITFSACEGGATLFKMDYFGEEAYLSQSAQLYLEVMIYSLEKVWSLTPSFRAEKSRTPRHLAEFWHLEAEAANFNFDDIMKVEENLVAHVVKRVLDENAEELDFIKRDTSILENVKPPFPRISYDEAIDILRRKGLKMDWGDDIGADEERVLANTFDTPFFVYNYPMKIKPFYVKQSEDDERVCLSADLMAPEGFGEITTGGQREEDIEKLIARIRNEGFDPEDYSWYLDIRKYGSVPHSGFGLGIERFMMWLTKVDHIREVIPFPRLARRKELTL